MLRRRKQTWIGQPFFTMLNNVNALTARDCVHLIGHTARTRYSRSCLSCVIFGSSSIPSHATCVLNRSSRGPFPMLTSSVRGTATVNTDFVILAYGATRCFCSSFRTLAAIPVLRVPHNTITHVTRHCPGSHFPQINFLNAINSHGSNICGHTIRRTKCAFIRPASRLRTHVASLVCSSIGNDNRLGLRHCRSILHSVLSPTNPYTYSALVLNYARLDILGRTFPLPRLPIVSTRTILIRSAITQTRTLHT